MEYYFLWDLVGIALLITIAYFFGHFVNTRFGSWFDYLLEKIPGFTTIKDLVNIFNSSKKGEHEVLVVLVKGFSSKGYNVGLMYSQKPSIIKNHYTVTLSQSPLPNGGFLFEINAEDIKVIKNVSFDHNLQYLLSMGVNSLADIAGIDSVNLEDLPSLVEFLEKK